MGKRTTFRSVPCPGGVVTNLAAASGRRTSIRFLCGSMLNSVGVVSDVVLNVSPQGTGYPVVTAALGFVLFEILGSTPTWTAATAVAPGSGRPVAVFYSPQGFGGTLAKQGWQGLLSSGSSISVIVIEEFDDESE